MKKHGVIKKCIAKGAIERYGNNYMCKPLISKEEVEDYETKDNLGSSHFSQQTVK